jgi:hypothetical protein
MKSPILGVVLFQADDVQALVGVNCGVLFDNSDDFCAGLIREELGSPIAYISKTLNNDAFALQAFGKFILLEEDWVVHQLFETEVDS